jgi:hypothetical protein
METERSGNRSAITNIARRLSCMRSTKEADARRSAVRGGTPAEREYRPADSADTPAQRRLTLRHLHGLIEALREEHMKLEMRVDRLSELVDRMAAPDGGERREPALVGDRNGEFRLAALPDLQEGRDAAIDRGAAQPAATEDRAAFGIAIWAGVERAIGNAAVMLASGRETGADAADRPDDRIQAPVEPAALFRRQRPPEHGQREVPIESLLLELREAARIADEIAAHASADFRTDPAHPARAPDMSDGEMSGRSPSAGDAADGPEPGAAASPIAGAEPGASGLAAGGSGERNTGSLRQDNDAVAAAAVPGPHAEPAAAGNGGLAVAQAPDAHAAAAQVPLARVPQRQPAPDMPAITIPRSERHRVHKKRSLWARLFRRQHAGS